MTLLILTGVACSVLFFRAATYERMSPWPWAVSSIGLTLVVSQLASSIIWVLLAQVALFGAMWAYNARRPTSN